MAYATIISKKYGKQTINVETFNPMFASKDSTIFKVVEHVFNEWFSHNTQPGAPMAKDIKGMYFGECDQPPIYSISGAIRQGIENLIEEIKAESLSVVTTAHIMKMDIECAFE